MGYFDNLNLDEWYKVVAYLGGIITLLSLTVQMQIFSNEVMTSLGLGAFLYGIGRWKNMKTKTQFAPGHKLSWEERDTDIIGLILEISGVILILIAVSDIINLPIP